MQYSTAEYHDYGAPAVWLWFMLAFLVMAVLIVRSRPAWMLRFWLGAWLVGVAVILIWMGPSELRYAPVPSIAAAMLGNGLPTRLVILWLHLTRRHVMFSRLAVQLATSLAVFVGGLWFLGVIYTGP